LDSISTASGIRPADIATVPTRTERILQAAGQVFLTKGYEQATTLEIAARARVSKRDLYRLFASKQGILEALIAASSVALAIPADLGDPRDLDEMLAILAAYGPVFLTNYLDAHKIGLYRIAIAEAPRSNNLGKAIKAAGADPVAASASTFVTKAIMCGIVRPEDAEMITTAFFDVLVGDWHLNLLTGTHAPPDAETIDAQSKKAVEVVRRLVLAGQLERDAEKCAAVFGKNSAQAND